MVTRDLHMCAVVMLVVPVKRGVSFVSCVILALPPVPAASPSRCYKAAGGTSPELSSAYSKVQKQRQPRRAGEHQESPNSSHMGSLAGKRWTAARSKRSKSQLCTPENEGDHYRFWKSNCFYGLIHLSDQIDWIDLMKWCVRVASLIGGSSDWFLSVFISYKNVWK